MRQVYEEEMNSLEQQRASRASRACKTCKDRKKGCDKCLPQCGYCKTRNLGCEYGGSVCADSVKWQQWSPSKSRSGNIGSTIDQEVALAPGAMVTQDAAPAAANMDLSDFLWTRVQRVVASLDMSSDQIADEYFDGIHTWLPILSPPRFRQTLHSFRHASPPGDFSALLLSMCLITFRPPRETSQPLSTGPPSLYVTARSVFIEAQAVACTSTALIQAAVLIAAYEYTTGRVEAAYVQIGLASRMCCVLGIDRTSFSETLQSDASVMENLNVWWGVIILERQILLEAPDHMQYPVIQFPFDESHTPVQLDHDESQNIASTIRLAPVLPMNTTTSVGGFGRQAQAVYLLDKVFSVLKHVNEEDPRISALKSLDGELQHLLTITMGEYRGPGSHCGANATVLRTLYLLHQSAISRPDPASCAGGESRATLDQNASSRAALDTVARMMAQVATDHVKKINNIDRLPVCAIYNFQLCLKHIEARQASLDDDLLAAVGDLDTLVGAFKQRWQLWGDPHASQHSR